MLNSKEAIQELYNEREYLLGEKVNNKTKNWHNDITHYDNIGHCLLTIRQDLERLEKENQELKERYKHRAEISNDLCKAVKQYEKAFDIIVSKIEFEDLGEMQSGNMYRGYFNDCFDEHEYELLKEVFGNE